MCCVAYFWILNSCVTKKYHKKREDLFAFENVINYLVSFLEKCVIDFYLDVSSSSGWIISYIAVQPLELIY